MSSPNKDDPQAVKRLFSGMQPLAAVLIVFSEPNFPVVDVASLIAVPGAIEARSVDELARELAQPNRVLVWRHGSAFPSEAWTTIAGFLDAGGSLLHLGGEPFMRPVSGPPGQRIVQPRTLSCLKAIRLNQCYPLDASRARLRHLGPLSTLPDRTLEAATAFVLEPRLCDTKDFAHEDGSPGSRDANVTPLAHLFRDGDETFPFAAAGIAIDRLRGPWAGGRWVLWLLSQGPTGEELDGLIREARREPVDFRVDPTFGCFHEGEQPSVLVRLHRPRAASATTTPVQIEARDSAGAIVCSAAVEIRGGTFATTLAALPGITRPGLYRVTARGEDLPDATTGFWIFDAALFSSGDSLTFDSYTLRRNGRPEPVVGTTMMSGSVHRKFLFEPNAAVWDDTFAELRSIDINLVRTGVWSAYRKIMLDPGVVDEAWLRALEAYYLSARRHGIPVLFTFFAFLPEMYGGQNPYLDPRAVEAQASYVAAVAQRFAPAKEILWDLINEPSFSSPQHLWLCRPNGDRFEREAFINWLKPHSLSDWGATGFNDWETVVRARWRLTPDETIGLPTIDDFDDRHLFEGRRPYRAADYVHFAQDVFTSWANRMRRAIRDAGSAAAITVGQDEGGLGQRPNPLFHHEAVEFTSMHTWWNNDALLWDGLASKAGGKPLLVSETGIMQRELLSGEAIRAPDDFAKLLSRKVAYAFAAGAFGVVQWCYEVNPHMASDNEVAIGLKRVDGSYKPEHAVLREFADFVGRNRARFQSPADPAVVLVVPTAEIFSPRDSGTAAVRAGVEALARLGVTPRLVPDHRLAHDLGAPKVMILPACRGLSESGWSAMRGAAGRGAMLVCSGWFEEDDAGLAARRIGVSSRSLSRCELIEWPMRLAPAATPSGAHSKRELRMPLAVTQSAHAAAGPLEPSLRVQGGAKMLHHPVPLEWSGDIEAIAEFYRIGLREAGVVFDEASSLTPGVVLRRLRFRDVTLLIAINESSRDEAIVLGDGSRLAVPAGVGRLAVLDARSERVLDTMDVAILFGTR